MSGTRPRTGPGEREDWLRRHAADRGRLWALEEQLLAPSRAPEREGKIATLARMILEERVELDRLQIEVAERTARLAELEVQLRGLLGSPSRARPWELPNEAPVADAPRARVERATVELGQPDGASEREYWLHRCHGFRVEADERIVGIVEGVRFGSSATRPDLIEIRGGRFGRRLFLVPVEDVEDVIEEEQTLLLRGSALAGADLVHALLARLRERLGHQVAT